MSRQEISERAKIPKRIVQGSPGRLLLPQEESKESEFRGPLGLWPWPLINLLLALVENVKARSYVQPRQLFPRTATRRVEYIRDRTGRIIEKYEEIEV